jgi:hypothetical protein
MGEKRTRQSLIVEDWIRPDGQCPICYGRTSREGTQPATSRHWNSKRKCAAKRLTVAIHFAHTPPVDSLLPSRISIRALNALPPAPLEVLRHPTRSKVGTASKDLVSGSACSRPSFRVAVLSQRSALLTVPTEGRVQCHSVQWNVRDF